MLRKHLAPTELLVLCVAVLPAVVRADTVQVAGLPNSDVRPRVSANPNTDDYLVAWQHEYSLTDQDVYVRRVGGDGVPQGAEAGAATTST